MSDPAIEPRFLYPNELEAYNFFRCAHKNNVELERSRAKLKIEEPAAAASSTLVSPPSKSLLLKCAALQDEMDAYAASLNRGWLPSWVPKERPGDWYTRAVHEAVQRMGVAKVAIEWETLFPKFQAEEEER
jgi:hypothetical protein